MTEKFTWVIPFSNKKRTKTTSLRHGKFVTNVDTDANGEVVAVEISGPTEDLPAGYSDELRRAEHQQFFLLQ